MTMMMSKGVTLFGRWLAEELRRKGLTDILLSDIDKKEQVIRVTLKGGRIITVPYGKRAARDLDRYLRARDRHPRADEPHLWLGQRGAMTVSGIYQVVRDRAEQAGIGKAWTHLFRHKFAHEWLSSGGQERDLMSIAGWQSPAMIGRYGASAASARAREAHKKFSPGDRI